MQSKIIPAIIILIILLLGGFFMFSTPKEVTAPPIEENTPIQNTTQEIAPAIVGVPKQYEILYTADGFAPAVLSITAGDTVTFVNNSKESFWPASNNHPTHTAYPEFDAKAKIEDGKTYEFTFTKSGEWGYHNHLNPKMVGVVVVK